MTFEVQNGTIGQTISLVIQDGGIPKDLTNCTVTLSLYKQGTNALLWTHTATVIDAPNGVAVYVSVAGDFDTNGMYYSYIEGTYIGGDIFKKSGPIFEIIENNAAIVTAQELLQYMNIPEENGLPIPTIEQYIEDAETMVDLEVTGEINTQDPSIIKTKKVLIRLKAAINYFRNSGEGAVNPDIRLQKIESWQTEYNIMMNGFNDVLSSTSTGSGTIRRVKNTSYSDPASRDYEDDPANF